MLITLKTDSPCVTHIYGILVRAEHIKTGPKLPQKVRVCYVRKGILHYVGNGLVNMIYLS